MGRADQNTGFTCAHCGGTVRPLTNGSYRNHCPFCLVSRHLDEHPGDRASRCGGLMDAVGMVASRKGWQVVHRCRRCGVERRNRIAQDDAQPDAIDALARLTVM